ncbi:hypothetical protein DAPPUDRAFT_238817 [Daphnia pulex]|uniref:Uncharacterized protein n=1 Tax=Daphnia pulex TaxID=6669 RepID=E9G7H2_DAPPU|nr:hypothetical protein DAPPUDRAFT_238817 [Daphnia pulex]|eukprot:EFX84642.1 hypothetical protein DAPPUDRAFT_238817 [Daphnia pulex]
MEQLGPISVQRFEEESGIKIDFQTLQRRISYCSKREWFEVAILIFAIDERHHATI